MNNQHGKVVVIMGGDSKEREVSFLSGNAVFDSLKRSGIDVYKFDPLLDSLQDFINAKYDKAVVMLHGQNGEDGVIQGLLEYLKIPYSGSGVMASAIAMDKYRTKLIWQSIGIPLAHGQFIHKDNFDQKNFKLAINLPVIVKPCCEGSTIGLSKVYILDDLLKAIELAFTSDTKVLIEELIDGSEYTIVINQDQVYPFIKIEAPKGDYDYQNKYFTDDTCYLCPYSLGELDQVIAKYARDAYNAVGARGIARIDFMQNKQGEVFFLEINTIPGMTNHSLVPMAYKAKGISFDQLCLEILDQVGLDGNHNLF